MPRQLYKGRDEGEWGKGKLPACCGGELVDSIYYLSACIQALIEGFFCLGKWSLSGMFHIKLIFRLDGVYCLSTCIQEGFFLGNSHYLGCSIREISSELTVY